MTDTQNGQFFLVYFTADGEPLKGRLYLMRKMARTRILEEFPEDRYLSKGEILTIKSLDRKLVHDKSGPGPVGVIMI